MEHDWKKDILIPAVATKNRDAANLTHHFHGGPHLHKSVWHPTLTKLVITFIRFDKGHVLLIHWKSFDFLTWLTRENVDLTWKQHSRHQQFWRFRLSQYEASSRLPRSRDHLVSHSMSKASPPQGPDIWYLIFYENKVPIYQTTISNSLYFKISH